MQQDRAAGLSHKDLFLGFFEAGVFGFGGVLPITAGLVLAAALVLTVQSVSGWLTACIAAGCAARCWDC